MGRAMTFVVLAWLSVVLLLGAWMIAQSGRYISNGGRLFDTYTGTVYFLREGRYVIRWCGPSDYFCEKYEPRSHLDLVEVGAKILKFPDFSAVDADAEAIAGHMLVRVRGKVLAFPNDMDDEDIGRVIRHSYLPKIEKEKTDVPTSSEGMMLGAFFGT